MKRKLIIWFLALIILLTFSFKTTISAKEISQQDMINIEKLRSKGDYEKAEEYINKFLNDKTLNKNTAYYCSLLFSQLFIKLNGCEYDKAEEIFLKLEESIERVFGKNSNQLIIVYTTYLKMQNTTNNDKVFIETVEKIDKIITESKDLSPIVLGKYNSIIAKFYFTRSNYKKAEEYSKKSIEYFSKQAKMDPDFVNPMIILSDINVLNGNYTEAEKGYEKLMEYIEFYKSVHPEISKVIILGYIDIKRMQGDLKSSIKFLNENKEFLDGYFQENKDEQKEYYLILGNLYSGAFDYEQSEFYYLELIKLLDENDKKYRSLTYSSLCLLNYFQGKMKLAEKYGILALNIYNKLEKPDFANMSGTLNALGLISTFRFDFKNAERLHKDAIKYLKKVHSEKEVLASQPYICNLA
ncbi:hypothetical protein KAU33_04910, partial [Candidatus Dependentiae bacterium]|nr:hypothetical protein [Candidatus Dependentiae bacterium]